MQPSEAKALAAVTGQLACLVEGKSAEPIIGADDLDPAVHDLVKTANYLIAAFTEARAFVSSLAEGNLELERPPKCLLASPYKQLHANLRHLTWQARRIAEGDYSQRVHFMGEFAASFNSMVEALDEKRRVEESLRQREAQIKRLEGIVPICMFCKKIRNDTNLWEQVERYVSEHSDAQFSHSICPACFAEKYGDELGDLDKPSK